MKDFEIILPCCGFTKEYESIIRLENGLKCEICRENIELERIIEFKRNKYIILLNQAENVFEKYKNQINLREDKVNEIYMKISMKPITKYYQYKQNMRNLSHLLEKIKKLSRYFENKKKYKIDGKSYKLYLENDMIIRLENTTRGLKHNKIDISNNKSFENIVNKLFNQERLITLKNGNVAELLNDKVKIRNSGSCIKTINNSNIPITSIVGLENGNLAIGSGDGRIQIWDMKSFECIKTLLHEQQFSIEAWLPPTFRTFYYCLLIVLMNGNLASGYRDGIIKIWDKTKFECIKTLDGNSLIIWRIRSMAVLENGNLAAGYHNGKIRIWDMNSFLCVKKLESDNFFDDPRLAVLLNGNLVSGDEDGKIKIWDKTSFECIETLCDEYYSSVICLLVLENGSLVSGFRNGDVLLWVNNNIVYPFQ